MIIRVLFFYRERDLFRIYPLTGVLKKGCRGYGITLGACRGRRGSRYGTMRVGMRAELCWLCQYHMPPI